MRAPGANVTLRSAEPADEAFLFSVYASTRQRELDLVDWPDEMKSAFLRQQFAAQHTYYHANYLETAFQLILLGARPVGRLYVARWPDEIRVVDIALLPQHRGKGIGTELLRSLQIEASAAQKPLTVHVERFNPAVRLYERLGFSQKEDLGVYLLLEWSSDQLNTAS